MSTQAPLLSLMGTSLVSLLEPSSEQPKLPATTSVIMTALKQIEINLLLQNSMYKNSPNTAIDNAWQKLCYRRTRVWSPMSVPPPTPRDPAPFLKQHVQLTV